MNLAGVWRGCHAWDELQVFGLPNQYRQNSESSANNFDGEFKMAYKSYPDSFGLTFMENLELTGIRKIELSEVDEYVRLYAMTISGLFRSIDSGKTWSQLTFNYGSDVIVHPSNGDLLYLVDTNGISKSFDGISFQRISDGPVPIYGYPKQYQEIFVDPNSFNILYLPVNVSNGSSPGELYKSIDHGETWAKMSLPLSNGTNIQDLTFDPVNSNIIIVATNSGVFLSKNLGEEWEQARFANMGTGLHVYSIHSSNGVLFAATNGGVYTSDNSGSDWSRWNVDDGNQYFAISSNDHFVVAGGMNGAIYLSPDLGGHWININSGGPDIWSIDIDENNNIYSGDGSIIPLPEVFYFFDDKIPEGSNFEISIFRDPKDTAGWKYRISGDINESDIAHSLSQEIEFDSNGKAVVAIPTIADKKTEGAETLNFNFGQDPIFPAYSASISILDSSNDSNARIGNGWDNSFRLGVTEGLADIQKIIFDTNGSLIATGFLGADLEQPLGLSRPAGFYDGILISFDSQGEMVWATQIGGNGDDRIFDAAVATDGGFWIGGSTSSTDFNELTPSGREGFVAEIGADGSVISSFLVPNGGDSVDSL